MLKAILFDLDMTLIDFMKMKSKASDAAAKAMVKAGLDMPVEEAKKKLFDTYFDEGIESDTAFQRFLKENNSYSERILATAINAYIKTKYQHMEAYPDVEPTLKKIKEMKIKIAIVTDAPRLKAYQRLDIMGIADMFDAVVGFEDTGKTKPSTLPFEKALTILGVKPQEAMHVGDWPERDIAGAKKLGMKTCLAKYGFSEGKYIKADYEINNFKELLEVVKNA
ncbi:MAG: HAD-IA family hydrolase [Nanoarchaeota archaeon]|nr:HAD-IA family hydrolase [Nanoarchaeota archaeon]